MQLDLVMLLLKYISFGAKQQSLAIPSKIVGSQLAMQMYSS